MLTQKKLNIDFANPTMSGREWKGAREGHEPGSKDGKGEGGESGKLEGPSWKRQGGWRGEAERTKKEGILEEEEDRNRREDKEPKREMGKEGKVVS